MEHHPHEDVYTGVGIANRNRSRLTTHKKLTEDEVGGLAWMWADIDWAHPVHRKPNLPPSLEQAMETLEGAKFEPIRAGKQRPRPTGMVALRDSLDFPDSPRTTNWEDVPPSGGTSTSMASTPPRDGPPTRYST